MSGEFCDTNVLIYAYDTESADKLRVASALTSRLWEEPLASLAHSAERVLRQHHENNSPSTTCFRNCRHPGRSLRVDCRFPDGHDDLQSHCGRGPTIPPKLLGCPHCSGRVQAVREARVDVLWSEDLQDGQLLLGFTVRNPFI